MSTPGTVFSIPEENPVVPGCTVSRFEWERVYHFSLAPETDISPESYPVHRFFLIHHGQMTLLPAGTGANSGQCCLTQRMAPSGVSTAEGCIYTEITLRSDTNMNKILKAGEVFTLKDLIPYQEQRIVNMDLISDPGMKFVLMSFDAGTALAEHAAPGEALVFALDGEGIISYEGKDHLIRAGETFKFEKNGMHAVRADSRFKMALLLTLK